MLDLNILLDVISILKTKIFKHSTFVLKLDVYYFLFLLIFYPMWVLKRLFVCVGCLSKIK